MQNWENNLIILFVHCPLSVSVSIGEWKIWKIKIENTNFEKLIVTINVTNKKSYKQY